MTTEQREPPRQVTVVCDFDGTITDHDVWDAIVARFDERDWSVHGRAYAAGTLGSRAFYEEQVQEWPLGEEEVLAFVRAECRVDPHFGRFVTLLCRRHIPLHIVSDGFGFYIREILRRDGLRDLPWVASELRFSDAGELALIFPHYRPDCRRGMANCKCAHLLGWRATGQRIVYIGDSYSDVCAVRYADLIFAKTSLAAYCAAHGIAHVPFASFEEIIASPHLAEMLATVPRREGDT